MRHVGWLLAASIGAVAGFSVLFLRELGWFLAAATVVILGVYYVREGRVRDIGVLLTTGGAVPAWILGGNALRSVTDPSVSVGPETWLMLMVAVSVAALGVLVAYGSWNQPPRDA